MSILITEMLSKSFDKVEDASNEEEREKLGNLRAGNSGVVTEKGNNIGSCARKAYLRLKGVGSEEGPSEDRRIMFAAGKKSEEIWRELLEMQWKDEPGRKRTILAEEEIPVEWSLGRYKITGRPDLVLCEIPETVKDVVPVLGLELKMVSSLWTARDVRFKLEPKLPHLIQTAHYSWKLGVSFKLCYISYVDYAVTGWVQRHFPKMGEAGEEALDFGNDDKPKKVKPFFIVYDVAFDSKGRVQFKLEGAPDVPASWTDTQVTKKGIEEFYKSIIRADTEDSLPVRPLTVNFEGKKANYSMCDYCSHKQVCDSYKGESASGWSTAVASNMKKEGI